MTVIQTENEHVSKIGFSSLILREEGRLYSKSKENPRVRSLISFFAYQHTPDHEALSWTPDFKQHLCLSTLQFTSSEHSPELHPSVSNSYSVCLLGHLLDTLSLLEPNSDLPSKHCSTHSLPVSLQPGLPSIDSAGTLESSLLSHAFHIPHPSTDHPIGSTECTQEPRTCGACFRPPSSLTCIYRHSSEALATTALIPAQHFPTQHPWQAPPSRSLIHVIFLLKNSQRFQNTVLAGEPWLEVRADQVFKAQPTALSVLLCATVPHLLGSSPLATWHCSHRPGVPPLGTSALALWLLPGIPFLISPG